MIVNVGNIVYSFCCVVYYLYLYDLFDLYFPKGVWTVVVYYFFRKLIMLKN